MTGRSIGFITVCSICASRAWSALDACFAPTNLPHFRLCRTAHCADIRLLCHVGTWVRLPPGQHKNSLPQGERVFMLAERGKEPMTAGGRNLIGSEVSRNKRSPQCGAAPIEAAGGSHPAPRAIGKAPAFLQVPNSCGAGGIRTHVPVARQTDFESAPL